MKSNAIFICLSIFFYVSASSQQYIDFSTVSLTNSYTSVSFFDSDSVQWHAIKVRSGSTTQNNRAAACLNKSADACLYSDSITYGIAHLSFLYQQAFSTNCNAQVFINDSCVGLLTTKQEQGITHFFSVDVSWCTTPAVIKIIQVSGSSGQLSIADIRYVPAWEPIKPFTLKTHTYANNTLRLSFSEHIVTATILCNGAEHSFAYESDSSIIYISNITACGNILCCIQSATNTLEQQINDTCVTFYKTQRPQQHDIIITEMYIHPKQECGPTPFEYIELYNTSACPIDISNMRLIRDELSITLPSYILPAKSTIVLYDAKETWIGSDSILHIGVSKFPSLPNSQAHIALVGIHNEIISSVAYSDSWYGHEFKKNGGWSLEKIDITNYSETADNWRASESFSGGTPGYSNSVNSHNIDTATPSITALYFLSDTSVFLQTSKNISLYQIAQCTLSNTYIDSVVSDSYSLQKFILHLQSPCVHGIEYIFANNHITDFSKNTTEWEYKIALFDSLLQRNAIIIHELLSYPEQGTSSFIELYNTSNQYYNLADMYVCRIYNSKYSSIVPLSEVPCIFAPKTYAVISEDIEYWKSQSNCAESALFVGIKSLPTLPNSEGNCIILNKWGHVIDSIWYNETLHNPSLYSTRGISLERVSIHGSSNSPANWQSAISPSGNYTPGCQATTSESVKIIAKSNIINAHNKAVEFECSSAHNIKSITINVYAIHGAHYTKFAYDCNTPHHSVFWYGNTLQGNTLQAGAYIVTVSCELHNSIVVEKSFRCLIQK